MPRIPPVDPAAKGPLARLFLRFVYFMTRRQLGRVVMPVQITAHNPRLLFGMAMFEDALSRTHLIPEDLKELAQVRVATLVGCPF